MTPADAWTALEKSPYSFLQNNMLTIASVGAQPSGKSVIVLEQRTIPMADGTSAPDYAHQVIESGTVMRRRWLVKRVAGLAPDDVDSYQMPADTETVVHRVGYYLKMVDKDEAADQTHFALPLDGNANLLFTSQLTGCTFAYGSQMPGGCCRVCHIASRGDEGRAAVRNTAVSRMEHPGGATVFEGSTDYNQGDGATVVGHLTNGRWQFVAQKGGRGCGAWIGVTKL